MLFAPSLQAIILLCLSLSVYTAPVKRPLTGSTAAPAKPPTIPNTGSVPPALVSPAAPAAPPAAPAAAPPAAPAPVKPPTTPNTGATTTPPSTGASGSAPPVKSPVTGTSVSSAPTTSSTATSGSTTSAADTAARSATAKAAFAKIQGHVFGDDPTTVFKDAFAGRHLASAWKAAHATDGFDTVLSHDTTTDLIQFKTKGKGKNKTTWNDTANGGKYTKAQITKMCTDVIAVGMAAAGSTTTPQTSSSVVQGAGANICVKYNLSSCFPLSTAPATGALGSKC